MKDFYKPLETKELPAAPHWSKAIGVGIVVMGLAIGTGELIMWPHLVAKFGLGILWGAFLGITLQFFINREVARLAAYTGESFFTSSARFFPWLTPFWLLAAFLLYIWPGWAAAIGTTLTALTGVGNHWLWAWASLGLVLALTFTGRVAYQILERVLKIVVPVFFLLLVIISFLSLNAEILWQTVRGMFNFGWLPEGIDLSVFLGATVFSGAGGLLNLCVSLWYRDKGVAMGRYAGRITNPITGRTEAMAATGYRFEQTPENLKNWKQWLRFINIDQGVIFWLLGLTTLVLLASNAFAVLTPKGLVPEGLAVAVVQANIFGEHWGQVGYNLFLLMAFLMLFSVMWTVIDAFTRIVADILYVNSHEGPFKRYLPLVTRISAHYLYYGLIVAFVLVSAFLIPLQQPLFFLTVSSVLGGLAMALYLPIVIFLNQKMLPPGLQSNLMTKLVLFCGFVFYTGFGLWLILSLF